MITVTSIKWNGEHKKNIFKQPYFSNYRKLVDMDNFIAPNKIYRALVNT